MAVKWKMKSLKKCSFIYANFNHFYPPTSTLNTRSVTLHNSGGSQCVSLGKDDRANATGSWSLRTDGNEGSQATSHPKAGWAQTKALGCVFPGWARVLILSCLQSTLSLHSSPTYSFIVSTLTSFLFFWSVLICPLTHTFFYPSHLFLYCNTSAQKDNYPAPTPPMYWFELKLVALIKVTYLEVHFYFEKNPSIP